MLKTEFDSLMTMQHEIGVWSRENFGDQTFHNPLLGVAEEAGEFFEAGSIADMCDAAADAMIFLMDFLERWSRRHQKSTYLAECVEEFERKGDWEIFKQIGTFNAIPVFTGRLSRSVLKLKQGIRKGEDHYDNLKLAVACLWYSYDRIINYTSGEQDAQFDSMFSAVDYTWKNVVKKRDWTPETKVDGEESSDENRDER